VQTAASTGSHCWARAASATAAGGSSRSACGPGIARTTASASAGTASTVLSSVTSSPSARSVASERSPPGAAQRIGPVVGSPGKTASVSVHGRASPRARHDPASAAKSGSSATK
jgi:hypothetical protein